MMTPLVVIGDFNVVRTRRVPGEADPPLIVDSDAVLPAAIAAQLFEPVAGRNPQIIEGLGGVED
jgi:hypothetical protein